jgi:S-formylglutathione hydrolase
MTAAPELLSRHGAYGGAVSFHRHAAAETACDMRFAVYLPPQAERRRVPSCGTSQASPALKRLS